MSYLFLKEARLAVVDVDDTILLWNPENYSHAEDEVLFLEDEGRVYKFLPNKKQIDFLWRLKLQGYAIIIWSQAGNNWAKKVVDKLGLQDLPLVVSSKPEFAVDDLLDATKIIKQVLWIHPDTGEFKRND